MDYLEIRRLVIIAMFSDDQLLESLVLKGGSALELVHHVVTRGSLDVDLSIAGEFQDLEDTKRRIFRALHSAFERHGLLVFDETFQAVPPELSQDRARWWGGYRVEFKLIAEIRAADLARSIEQMRRQAEVVDPRQGRKFRIEISKHECCEGKVPSVLDGQTIYVYTEEMCVIEKLRAICQQMPEYRRSHATARARDFYDIYQTVNRKGIDLALPENLELFRCIFSAKRVSLALLPLIAEAREFHRPDWDAVKSAVIGDVLDFDFYFDFVVEEIRKLESLWKE